MAAASGMDLATGLEMLSLAEQRRRWTLRANTHDPAHPAPLLVSVAFPGTPSGAGERAAVTAAPCCSGPCDGSEAGDRVAVALSPAPQIDASNQTSLRFQVDPCRPLPPGADPSEVAVCQPRLAGKSCRHGAACRAGGGGGRGAPGHQGWSAHSTAEAEACAGPAPGEICIEFDPHSATAGRASEGPAAWPARRQAGQPPGPIGITPGGVPLGRG